MEISDILSIIRVITYTSICIMALWRFVYIRQVRWISLSVAIMFFNSILVGGSILLDIDPQLFRDLQTLFVIHFAIALGYSNMQEFKMAKMRRGI